MDDIGASTLHSSKHTWYGKTRYYGCRIPKEYMCLPVCEWGNVAAGELHYPGLFYNS